MNDTLRIVKEDELDWREKLVLRAFQRHENLRYFDLPPGVGHKTMAGLVKRGMVRVITEPEGNTRSSGGTWQRVN